MMAYRYRYEYYFEHFLFNIASQDIAAFLDDKDQRFSRLSP